MRDLTVRYGAVLAVRSVSLDVDSGTVFALCGPNGSGKTSAMAAIAGLISSDGSVAIGDARLDGMTPERRSRAGLAFVPDGRRLFGSLSVEQNLIVGASRVRGRRPARNAVSRILDEFPILRERRSQRADTLSGGEGQVLMIARALVSEPTVLLVDEPFEGLSREATRVVSEALAFAAAGSAAVLIASPDPLEGIPSIEMSHGALAVRV